MQAKKKEIGRAIIIDNKLNITSTPIYLSKKWKFFIDYKDVRKKRKLNLSDFNQDGIIKTPDKAEDEHRQA